MEKAFRYSLVFCLVLSNQVISSSARENELTDNNERAIGDTRTDAEHFIEQTNIIDDDIVNPKRETQKKVGETSDENRFERVIFDPPAAKRVDQSRKQQAKDNENNASNSHLEKRMGVIGPPPTLKPGVYFQQRSMGQVSRIELLPSSSQIDEHLKFGVPLPLSPHSPHNIFSVHAGVGLEQLTAQRQFDSENEVSFAAEDDLTLKLKALTKARELKDQKHHVIGDDGILQCDQFITAKEFYIRSPNYPYNYPKNTSCEYQVYRRDTSVCGVELTVLRFDIASADPITGYCTDHLSVQGRPFCGRRQRGDKALILFPGLLLSLKLETGAGYGASGLLLRGRQVSNCRTTRQLSRPIPVNPQCVRSFRGDTFNLRSPGYPGPYPHNSECWYYIHKRSENHCGVELVIDSFVLEAASCMFDYLEASQKRICGKKESGTKYYFPFSDDKLAIRFRSDESITRPGFLIGGRQVMCDDVKSLEDTYHDPKTLEDFLSVTASREDNLITKTGQDHKILQEIAATVDDDDDDIAYILALAGYAPLPLEGEKSTRQSFGRQLETATTVEDLYDLNDIDLVTVTDTTVVTTQEIITPENIPLVLGTTDDILSVGVGLNETDPYATISSSVAEAAGPITVIIVGAVTEIPIGVPIPSLTIISDITETISGKLGPCDEVYSGESFTLRSPKLTDDLPREVDCSFYIKRASDDICEIRVLLLDVSLAPRTSSGHCGDEHLTIAATKFCGGDEEKRVRMRFPGPLVRIRMYSNNAQSDIGFTAHIQQLRGADCNSDKDVITSSMSCDITVTKEVTLLLSPNYPGRSPNNIDCLITVVKANRDIQSITLLLDEFNLEESLHCINDFFSVGTARLCGHRSGREISFRFPGDELEMTFRTNGHTLSTGYRIHIRQNRFSGVKPNTPPPPPEFGVITPRPPFGVFTPRPPPPEFGVITPRPPFGVFTPRPPPQGFGFTQRPPHTVSPLKPPQAFLNHRPRPPPPQSNVIGVSYPTSTFRPPSYVIGIGGKIPNPGDGTFVSNSFGSNNLILGSGVWRPPRPPTFVETATEYPTMSKCGDTSRRRIVTIKSPGYPGNPPADITCVYTIEKFGNDVCQLKIVIEDLQIGSRAECGKSYLAIGSQQRLCGARKAPETRTYHFTDEAMKITFHTDTEGRDGGFHITVEQMPCGNFEPIGTFSGLHTVSGAHVFTAGPHIFTGPPPPPKESSIEIIYTSNIIDTSFGADKNSSQTNSDKNYINTNFGSVDYTPPKQIKPQTYPTHPIKIPQPAYQSDYHFGSVDYTPPKQIKPQTYPTHPINIPQPAYQSDYHYVYYYLPAQQNNQQKNRRPQKSKFGGGGFDIMGMMKHKFDAIKSVFSKGSTKGKGSVQVESEVKYKRPKTTVRPRPHRRPHTTTSRSVHFTPNRPMRYVFVQNPYYQPPNAPRPKKKRPTVPRYRYPQVYPTTPVTIRQQRPHYQYPNAYIVIPTAQLKHTHVRPGIAVTAASTLYTVPSPRPQVTTLRPIYVATPRPVYATTPRPVYATTPRPVYATTLRPVYVTTPRPVYATTPRPVYATTPRPIIYSSPRPVRLPTSPRPVIRIPQQTISVVTATPRPVLAPTGFPLTSSTIYFPGSPTAVKFQRTTPSGYRRPLIGYNAFIVTTARPGVISYRSQESRAIDYNESDDEKYLNLFGSASHLSSVTARPCGRVINEEEFFIKSTETSFNSLTNGNVPCTYTIAKSGSDKCSLVLEVQDYKTSGDCGDHSLASTRLCEQQQPPVNMLTSFSATGELVLQFNTEGDIGKGANLRGANSFVIRGRQLPCGGAGNTVPSSDTSIASASTFTVTSISGANAGAAVVSGTNTGVNAIPAEASLPNWHNWHVVATSVPENNNWRPVRPVYVGTGRRNLTWRVIQRGGRGIKRMKHALLHRKHG